MVSELSLAMILRVVDAQFCGVGRGLDVDS